MRRMNKALLLNKPWAIKEDFLVSAINCSMETQNYTIEEAIIGVRYEKNIVIVPVSGVLEPHFSFWSWLFGGISTFMLQNVLEQIETRGDIEKVILEIDSPGGDITGIQDLAKTISQLGKKKEVIASIKDMAASAAYWIASAANKIYMASKTASVGSIGVVAVHRDISKLEEEVGIKTTEIYAGKYKRIVSNYEPLTKEGKQYLQEQVDYLYSIFVEDIAKYRDKDKDYVLNMAEGKMFFGLQAVENGLADDIISPVELIKGRIIMTEEEKKKKEEDEKKEAEAEEEKKKEDEEDEENKEARQKGIRHERARLLAIDELSFSGFESIVLKAKKEGFSVEKTALEILKVQKERGGFTISDFQKDNVNIKNQTPPDELNDVEERNKLVATMVGHRKRRNKWLKV